MSGGAIAVAEPATFVEEASAAPAGLSRVVTQAAR